MTGKPVLLTVDDDPEVLRAIERDLRREYGATYRVLRASSGRAALDLLAQLRERGDPIALGSAVADGEARFWVTDFGANATLTFDPATEAWTSIPGSGPGANVRQILGRPGEVYLPESGLDRIMVVSTAEAP